MPGVLRARKRPSVAVDEDEERPRVSSASKRARHIPDAFDDASSSSQGNGEDGPAVYQPGSIVRVKLINFVTYTFAEFHLGPSLNMIIGPNGTGKSTLVCAICLGLGWGTQHLGRAKDVGEFVKHGSAEAEIEIELAASDMHPSNPIIRRRIQKSGSKSAFYIDGQPKSQKDVKQLAESFSIQINNLCQFLPQDRVVEFAKMDAVETLGVTLRAAASSQMVQWHEDLKHLRSEEKETEIRQQNEQNHLKTLQAKQTVERAEVDRYNQRQDLVAKKRALENYRPIITAKTLKRRYDDLKDGIRSKKVELQQYEADTEPARLAEEDMKAYRDDIQRCANNRKGRFEAKKRVVAELSKDIDNNQKSFGKDLLEIDTIKQSEKTRKSDVRRLENEIINLEHELKNENVDFDQASFTARLAELRTKKSKADREKSAFLNELNMIRAATHRQTEALQAKVNEKEHLNSRTGQQESLLSKLSQDTSRGWLWLKENMHTLSLKDKVYGPPIIECSVPDPKYADAVEALLGSTEFMAITCTNSADAQVIQNKLVGKTEAGGLGLQHIAIRTIPNPLSAYKPLVISEELSNVGFQGVLSDFIEGPSAVLAMLCDMAKIHRTAFAPRDLNTEQYAALQQYNSKQEFQAQVRKWVAGRVVYTSQGRAEYGLDSTNSRQIRKAQWFTGQPVATAELLQVEEAITTLRREIAEQKSSHDEKKKEYERANQEQINVETERAAVQAEHDEIKKAYATRQRLPHRIATKQKDLDDIKQSSRESAGRIKALRASHERAALSLAKKILSYANEVTQLRSLHESFLEAEIRLIEADSELEGFRNDNRELIETIEQRKREIQELEAEKQTKRVEIQRLHAEVREAQKTATEVDRAIHEEFQNADIEELDNEIFAVDSRLNLMENGNPDSIRAFEARKREIEKIERTLRESQDKLEQNRLQITSIREQWEPELDRIVSTINDAFSHNFERIGCAGHVGVKKDDDFDKWAIQIEVRFRENEPMAILDAHRQSGGERSVSTIFYLMALQSLARSPFRVVDEINQGMDPRNERMVHERMVDIACAEGTSQYFLVTPKLLNNLKFHPKMKVHCIASSEYMPDQETNLNFQDLAELALRVRNRVAAA